MEINMTEKQFRRLLDLVYIGNWVLNSSRGDDRIKDYDDVETLVFGECAKHGMGRLAAVYDGELQPSDEFAEGGIHEAIMVYEDDIFYEILAEELARRDLDGDAANMEEMNRLCDEYLEEFRKHGTDNVIIELDE
ncbi:MAG: hypothetical protein VB112_00255 [Oscillospiraceae bacterium]|nr:hypothetical protein [Oscillospiraceae bacterium]